jgi:hypothetical protein
MTDQPNNANDESDETDDWFQALTGQSVETDDDSHTQRWRTIGKIVRAEQSVAEESLSSEHLEHGKQRLMFRLAQEQVFKKGKPGRHWQVPFALAASFVAVAMVALFTFTNNPDRSSDSQMLMSFGELEQMRGIVSEPYLARSSNPDRDAQTFAGRLESMKIPFELHIDSEDANARLLKIQYDGISNRLELDSELEAFGITDPPESVVRLRFIPK